jgi:hypothetical protein
MELVVGLESSCLCNNYLTIKPILIEPPLHNPCLFIRINLASIFVLMLLSNQVASKPELVFWPLLSRRFRCRRGVSCCDYNGVLEQKYFYLTML